MERGFSLFAPVALHGVPLDIGAGRPGARLGPAALRLSGLADRLTDHGLLVRDHGDVVPDHPEAPLVPVAAPDAQRLEAVLAYARPLSLRAEASLAAGERPVFLGGDHSLSMGSLAGVARHCAAVDRPLFVLWVDAHGDFNTPDISPTGNPHGMALALACGEPAFSAHLDARWHAPVNPARVTLLGARDLDPPERALLAARGVEVLPMPRLKGGRLLTVLDRLLARVAAADGHLHVSFDLDALDPRLAPGVSTPVPGGFGLAAARDMMIRLGASGQVGSLDLVELNPLRDVAGRSATLLVELAALALGAPGAAVPAGRKMRETVAVG
ncbi:arginase [Azorhizobium oxalatiphilum]|uniref:Arginase n=1 Tax=Azorhizobium oxalatiphilum TaxID=980631 RepID=A0A917BWK4_9HYPH|nr:arginase [Azorhizobium oxalatiphilum]GGF61359.1 arginase [Azorhizobium oxalatiphilum]